MMRLDKMLANMGVGSRSEVKDLVKRGRVTVNGERVKKSDVHVDPDVDDVRVDGEPVAFAQFEYLMMNKPAGVVSATEDPSQKTVVDLVTGNHRNDLFPVGRLDKDTVGLLLLTNDGQLAHRLLAPTKHVDKIYLAHLDHAAAQLDVAAFQEGIDIGDEDLTLPAKLEIVSNEEPYPVLVTIHEGRYHQVKRMFEALDNKVVYLKRCSMGKLVLDDSLAEGEYRPLTEEERALFGV